MFSTRLHYGLAFLCAYVCLFAGSLDAWAEEPAFGRHPILSPSFQQKLNDETKSVLSSSDQLDVLVNGAESYPERWRLLENAKETIYFSTMYIFRDKTTKRLQELLIRKHEEGVDVKIIVNGVYRWGNPLFYRTMRKHGIEVQLYSSVSDVLLHGPYRFWKRHLHDKYLVVDGQAVITGGMNWSNRYASGGSAKKNAAWRDTDVLVTGPQAEIIHLEFLKRWCRESDPARFEEIDAQLQKRYANLVWPEERTYDSFFSPSEDAPYGVRCEGLTRFLYQQPFEDGGEAYMTRFYKGVMDQAQSHIWWQSISVRPAAIQKQALIDAAKRGVDVRLMTNSFPNMRMIPIGGFPLYILTRTEYKELLEAGVRIFEYYGDAPMHAKGFIVDDVVACISSYNATFTAEEYYTESGVAVYDTDAIQEVLDMFAEDFAQCTEFTIDDLGPERPNWRCSKLAYLKYR